jgi:hypothetical protein
MARYGAVVINDVEDAVVPVPGAYIVDPVKPVLCATDRAAQP